MRNSVMWKFDYDSLPRRMAQDEQHQETAYQIYEHQMTLTS